MEGCCQGGSALPRRLSRRQRVRIVVNLLRREAIGVRGSVARTVLGGTPPLAHGLRSLCHELVRACRKQAVLGTLLRLLYILVV